jgi:hypothetical protein
VTLLGTGTQQQLLPPSPDGFVSFLIERRRFSSGRDLQISYARDGVAVRKKLDLPTLKL